MTKARISVTVTPERLQLAQRLTGTTNVSALLDEALLALIDRVAEDQWLAGQGVETDLPGPVPVDLSSIPWEPE